MQQKRIKLSSSNQNSQVQTSNRVQGKVFEMNCQNMQNEFYQQIMMQSDGGRPSYNRDSSQHLNEIQNT